MRGIQKIIRHLQGRHAVMPSARERFLWHPTCYPQILNDSIPEERETGIRLGLEILKRCEEIWICGDRISTGMKREAAYAKDRGIPVRWISVCEIMENQTVQEIGEVIREGPETSQSHQKDVQFWM